VLLHPDSFVSLNEWMNKVKVSNWRKPDDIRNTFATADLLGNNCSRVIFNIGGNKYRLIVKYYFGEKQVHLFICWIGTHADYNKLCKKEKQYNIHIY
jgi:mRNA interferase HigB